MRRVVILSLTALLSFIPSALSAGYSRDGKMLNSLCKNTEGSGAFGVGMGYTTGVLDSLNAAPSSSPSPFCMPLGVTTEQSHRVVCKWLDKNPEDWHEPATYLIFKAMVETWPCR